MVSGEDTALWAALRWHWNIASLVIAAAVALITVPVPREPGREPARQAES
jgi:hypothetical protein